MKKLLSLLAMSLFLFCTISCSKNDPLYSLFLNNKSEHLEDTIIDFSKQIAGALGNSRSTFVLDDCSENEYTTGSSNTFFYKDIELWGQTYELTLSFSNNELCEIHIASTENNFLSQDQISTIQSHIEQHFSQETELFDSEDNVFKINEDVIFTFYGKANSQYGFIYLCPSYISSDGINYLTQEVLLVGSDIPAGLYYIKASSDLPAYWSTTNDPFRSSYNRSDSVDSFAYILVSEGEFLYVSDGLLLPADQAPIPIPASDGSYGEGQYLVGRDIPAGKYRLSCIAPNEHSFYYLSSNPYTLDYADHPKHGSLDNDVYLTVSDGQFLDISHGKFFLIEKPFTTYEPGTYQIGVDIPAGLYYVRATSSRLTRWQLSLDNTSQTVFADGSLYIFRYLLLSDGDYFHFTGADLQMILAEDAPLPSPSSDGSYSGGQYLVGRDIPAGKYKISPLPRARIFYAISSDPNGLNILSSSKPVYDDDKKEIYCTLNEGEYLYVRDSTFIFVE